MNRSYSELISFKTFKERYDYLRICQQVGQATFGGSRFLNQLFYSSPQWKDFRNRIIIRDNGCDLAMYGFEIKGKIYIHHITPITKDDLINRSPLLMDPENVVCVSFDTHQAIHYGDDNLLPQLPIERKPNDTIPWR